MKGFQDAIVDARLIDLPLTGYQFTWRFALGTPRAIEQRLDRAFATKEWMDMFPNARLLNLISPKSDHSPLLLQRDPLGEPHRNFSFRFENAWLREPDIDDVVRGGWSQGHVGDIQSHLRGCATSLSTWGRSLRLKFREEISACKEAMERVRDRRDSQGVLKFNRISRRLNGLILQEEDFWRQRSKSFWLKDGDQNTKFFHANATCRYKKKKIESLQRSDGTMAADPLSIKRVAGDYFQTLFTSQIGEYGPVTSAMEPKLSLEDNDVLTTAFWKGEF